MPLYLNVSNSLESLSEELAGHLKAAPNGVFEPHLIVTQTEGMNNWLKLQLAGHLGIAANCRFMKPNELIYHLYSILGGRYPDMLSTQNLTWLLFMLLGEKSFANRFPPIAAYFQNSGADKELKRMGLAEKVADLFDQYQVYRPEMIEQWNNTALNVLEDGEWQPYLWIKAKDISRNTLPDKTVIGRHILKELRKPQWQQELPRNLSAVHLFGLSIITEYHVRILSQLSAYTAVYFHLINPAPAVYWFEDRSEKQLARLRQAGKIDVTDAIAGNTLLTSWGRVVQNTFGLFFQHDAFINAYQEENVVLPEPDTLLRKIQHDVFSNATINRNPLLKNDLTDGSLTINSCYTVAREVEVLYNYLVHLVDQEQAALSPRDIVVMVSDIDAYAPYIKAVFNNAPYIFRFTIADESYAGNDNLFNALHALLQVNEDTFKAEDILQLLDLSSVRQRFGITDVALVRRVVDAAGIRFGITGSKEDDTYLVSWTYGIRRIMFGICMSGSEAYGEGDDSFFPLDMVEGSDAREVIRFCHFVEVLIQSVLERKQQRTITGWVGYVESVLHNLVYEPRDEAEDDYTTLMHQLSGYNLLNEYMNDAVPFEVFAHNFLKQLTDTTRSGLFVNGGITFCSLIPMRSIPFKVVALMGLNYDKFPRREQPASFNLMEKHKQRGDRNIKDNDKHLFLETLLSAREYLYISYLGQSAKDNTSQPPSALVDELIDYIAAGAEEPGSVRSLLVTAHPLQSFSRQYDAGNKRLYSYLNNALPTTKPVILPEKTNGPFTFDTIALDDLVRFFKNPFKAYYNKVLGIYYNDEQVLLSDTEHFTLDHRQQWQLKTQLLPLDEAATAQLKTTLLKTGVLPLKHMADISLQQAAEQVQPVRTLFQQATHNAKEQSISVSLTIDGTTLEGSIQQVYNNQLLQVSWSKNENKYLLEAWIRYLAGAATNQLSGLHFISGAKHEKLFRATSLSPEEAHTRLAGLINLYKAGLENILPFYPDFDIHPADVETLDAERFAKLVKDTLDNFHGSSADPYIMPEYYNGYFRDPAVLQWYKDSCRQLVVPMGSLFPGYYA